MELDSRIIRAELRRDADKISLMRRSIRELRARLSLGRGKHAKAIQRRAVLKGALNLLTDDNKKSFRFYLCTSLEIINPGYRGTVGDKLANGWTKPLRTPVAGRTGLRQEHRRKGLRQEHRRNGLRRERRLRKMGSGEKAAADRLN